MPSLFDDIKKGLKDFSTTAAEKAEELTKAGRLKLDVLGLNREIEKNFIELGGKVYELIYKEGKTRIKADDEVKKIVDRIATIEKTREEKLAEVDNLGSDDNIDVASVKKEEVE